MLRPCIRGLSQPAEAALPRGLGPDCRQCRASPVGERAWIEAGQAGTMVRQKGTAKVVEGSQLEEVWSGAGGAMRTLESMVVLMEFPR